MKHKLASLQHADPPGKSKLSLDFVLLLEGARIFYSLVAGGAKENVAWCGTYLRRSVCEEMSRGGPAGTSPETHKKAGHLAPCSRARILFCGPAGGFLGRSSDFVRRRLPLRIENMWGIVPRQGTPQSWGHAQRPESYRGNPFLAVHVSPSWVLLVHTPKGERERARAAPHPNAYPR